MKIVFWNIKQNKDITYVVDLVDRVSPDMLFLAECAPEIADLLRSRYKILVSRISTHPKVRGFAVAENLKCSLIHEYNNRLFLYRLTWKYKVFLLGTVHLMSKNHTTSLAQSLEAGNYVREIRMIEESEKQKKYNSYRRFQHKSV